MMNALSDKPGAMAPAIVSESVSAPVADAAPNQKRGVASFGARKMLRPAAAGVAVVAALVVGNWWLAEGRYLESTDNAYVQGDIAVLGSRIEGDVASINVVDNQVVHRGDKLLSLDPANWQAKLDQARGAAAEAAAAILTAQAQTRQSAASIAQARATVVQAEASITEAQAEQTRAGLEAGRAGSLSVAGWTSRQSNETAIADRRKADAAFGAAQAQRLADLAAVNAAEAQASQMDIQVIAAQARKLSADAAVRLAENDLANTVVRAPFDGTVGNRAAQLGQHVIPALQLLAVTPLREALYVVANFKETQLRHMLPGQKVLLTPDIDSAAAVTGRVDSFAPATGALFSLLPPENATGNFTKVVQRIPTKLVIDAANAKAATWLRAGLSVTAEVDTRGPDAERLGMGGQLLARLGLR